MQSTSIYIIILYPDDDDDVCSNDTLVDTPFQLISDFFQIILIKVFCFASFLQGCVGGGGGGGQQAC